MFETPFLYGGGWDAKADEGPEPVVVLSKETNQKAFGGANSVGKTVLWHDREFRVVGVLDDWEPAPKYFDVSNGSFDDMEEIYVPVRLGQDPGARQRRQHQLLEDRRPSTATRTSSIPNASGSTPGWRCARRPRWRAYRKFLDNYVIEQKNQGPLPAAAQQLPVQHRAAG